MASYDILIVDDSITTSRLIQMQLEAMGYTVAGIATNADEALKMVENKSPDLVLMDINLGEGPNGIVAADTIMHRHQVPVIYVTAYSDPETVNSASRSMPFGFINKPLRGSDLRVNIELAMARAHKITAMTSDHAVNDANSEYLNLSEALDHLVSGVIMVNEELKVTYQNRAAARMLRKHSALNVRENYLNCASARIRRDIVKSIVDRTSTIFTLNHETATVHFLLFPLSPQTTQAGQKSNVSVLFLFDMANNSQRIEELIRTLYKLSPTEARIASLLVFNPYLADISMQLGISYQTARTHLKHIYQKTDTNKLPALIQKIVTGPAGLLMHSQD